jgi:D-glycero-D-manno-heptose 1,7-bisphosphate phosphatase
MPDDGLIPGSFLDADGVWRQARADLSWAGGLPALFLDRDGVVVEEVHYLHRVEDLALIPGAAEFIAEANRRGIPVVVASNQAGIARGYFGWHEFQQVQAELNHRLERAGARVDLMLACPHYPEHPDRKPRPGMFRKAAEMAGFNLGRSWVVGDKTSDLEAGRAAGMAGGILVLTGHGHSHRDAVLALAPAVESSSSGVSHPPVLSGAPAMHHFRVFVENSIRDVWYALHNCQSGNGD